VTGGRFDVRNFGISHRRNTDEDDNVGRGLGNGCAYVIQKHGAKIKRDEDDAVRVGVTGTPSFFVNGQKVSPLSAEGLRRALETALLPK
jgi:protein-disulfide isomerase